ncbi:hypothetical protein ANANG_G00317880 [Anguilla anguilla]|uniref:Uncharacterized protein n=1 Tax=Anguilla anguilla TaxID=7936 RepID=A0A9D3LGS1_ANGAN|nr:hypothetical protein ANANG_G00317880 [Anguilla anguilla]
MASNLRARCTTTTSATGSGPTCTTSMRSAQPPSGTGMKTFRFRNHPAGGGYPWEGLSRVWAPDASRWSDRVDRGPPPAQNFETFGGGKGCSLWDKRAAHFPNRAREVCKLVGGVLFCGGVPGARAGLLSSFPRGSPARALATEVQGKFHGGAGPVPPHGRLPRRRVEDPRPPYPKAQNIHPVSET